MARSLGSSSGPRSVPGHPSISGGRGGRLDLLAVLVASALLGAPGCATSEKRPSRPEYDLRDPSAARRLEAVSTVEQTGDRSQVPVLIEMLDDDDDSVRMAAGSTLKALTGHDTGYRAFAPAEERHAQVVQWRAWWAGRGAGAPASGGGVPVRIAPSTGGAGYTDGGAHVRAP